MNKSMGNGEFPSTVFQNHKTVGEKLREQRENKCLFEKMCEF